MDDKRITFCTLCVKRQDDNKQQRKNKKENCEWYVKAGERRSAAHNGQRWRMWRVWMPENIVENKTVANYMRQMWLIKWRWEYAWPRTVNVILVLPRFASWRSTFAVFERWALNWLTWNGCDVTGDVCVCLCVMWFGRLLVPAQNAMR